MYPRGFPLLLLLAFFLYESAGQDYSWYDCGPPLTKAVNYQSITLYPSVLDVSSSLSLNIQAYIVKEIQPFTTTTIQVYRDGDLYVNSTQIEDLCSILSSNSISCPFNGDEISYTYEIASTSMPQIPSGDYTLKITNELDGAEVACLVIKGTVEGIQPESCTYTSTFQANLGGQFSFENPLSQREIGDWIQMNGGTVTNFGTSTPDVLPGLPATSFLWSLSGNIVNISSVSGIEYHSYTGTFDISYNGTGGLTTVYSGVFSLTDQIMKTFEDLSGEFTLTPGYSWFSQLSYPMTLGNLGPLIFSQNSAGGSYSVRAEQVYCTCAIDSCNVCGGDGSSCNLGTSKISQLLPSRAIAAIVVSAFGVAVLAVLVGLYIKRRRFIRPIIDDLDLLDPQKPDYGTMAINEIMNEGVEEDV